MELKDMIIELTENGVRQGEIAEHVRITTGSKFNQSNVSAIVGRGVDPAYSTGKAIEALHKKHSRKWARSRR